MLSEILKGHLRMAAKTRRQMQKTFTHLLWHLGERRNPATSACLRPFAV